MYIISDIYDLSYWNFFGCIKKIDIGKISNFYFLQTVITIFSANKLNAITSECYNLVFSYKYVQNCLQFLRRIHWSDIKEMSPFWNNYFSRSKMKPYQDCRKNFPQSTSQIDKHYFPTLLIQVDKLSTTSKSKAKFHK